MPEIALYNPIPSPKGREPRAQGQGDGRGRTRECVGNQLRVRWLLRVLRESVQRWGGGAGRGVEQYRGHWEAALVGLCDTEIT